MSKPILKKSKNKLIRPSVSFGDEKHVLEEIFEGNPEDMPTLKSVGFARIQGTNSWISYVLETKGKEVVAIHVEEPNLRNIAEESSKISFVNELMSQGIL